MFCYFVDVVVVMFAAAPKQCNTYARIKCNYLLAQTLVKRVSCFVKAQRPGNGAGDADGRRQTNDQGAFKTANDSLPNE